MAKSKVDHRKGLKVELIEDVDAGADAESARVIELDEEVESGKGREDSTKGVVLVEERLSARNFEVIAAWFLNQNVKKPPFAVWRGKVNESVLKNGKASLRNPQRAQLEFAIGRDVAFCREGKDGHRGTRVDVGLVLDVLEVLADQGKLPVVRRQRSVPTFTKDGRLLTEPGLDLDSGILLTEGLQVALGKGSMKRALRSLEFLNSEVLQGFRFRDPASRHNFIALLLLVVASDLVDDLVPLAFIAKRKTGEGATTLAQLIGILLTGDPVSTVVEEASGKIMPAVNAAIALDPPLLLLDNVEHAGDAAAIENWLTCKNHQFRLYGTHDTESVENRCIKILTTRRAKPSVDILRRSLPIFMGAKNDNGKQPVDRVHRRRELEGWFREHRVPILQALVDIVAAWNKAGQPEFEFPGSYAFPRFAAVIGGILHNVGCDQFLANWRATMDELDGEGTASQEFVRLWWIAHHSKPVKAAQLVDIIVENGIRLDPRRPAAGTNQHSLGHLLRHLADNEIAGYCIEDAGIIGNSHSYCLRKLADA
ncbi:MAG: hypothetical protein JJU11_18690 [Candidatus Sumerlaeia bacterium]|nr:hypothetical protein [Candidatus Sumerlaeia bacterium]